MLSVVSARRSEREKKVLSAFTVSDVGVFVRQFLLRDYLQHIKDTENNRKLASFSQLSTWKHQSVKKMERKNPAKFTAVSFMVSSSHVERLV